MNDRMTCDLSGKAALVTGANQGLGLAVAAALAQAGADIFICARGREKLAAAAKIIEAHKRPRSQRLIHMSADVSREDDVEAVGEMALAEFSQVHILVNNAGVYGPMGSIEDVGWAEWKKAFEINLYGSVLMCRKMLPHFRRHKYGKIIQISGGGATSPLPRLESYAASKAAVVRFAESLALDCLADHIDVNSVAPGLLDTRMLDQVLAAGPEIVGEDFYNKMFAAKNENKATPLEAGASLCLFLASSASDGLTGKLISAVWDDYEDWPNHLAELSGGDLYTLRRVTARDRHKNWGDK